MVRRPWGGCGGTTVVCVQPQEPVTGPAPQPPGQRGAAQPEAEATPGPDEKPTPRRRRLRLWLAVAAGVLGILCAGGIGVAVLLYDEETKIERTAPDAVVDNFLRAYLLNRDDNEASLYMCKSGAEFEAIANLRSEMINREKSFDVKVSVSWSTLTVVDVAESRKSVETSLVISGSSDGNPVSRRTESWSFTVVDDDGWRVCGAARVG
jgi:hypothetical protein